MSSCFNGGSPILFAVLLERALLIPAAVEDAGNLNPVACYPVVDDVALNRKTPYTG